MKYMRMTPWARYGSAERMIVLNRNVFAKFHDHLKDTLEDTVEIVSRNKEDEHDHVFDVASLTSDITGTQQDCFKIPIRQQAFLGDRQREAIESLFPFHIGNMKFELCTIFDYDYDGERSWQPKIAFSIVETSPEQTRDDQIFIYWDA